MSLAEGLCLGGLGALGGLLAGLLGISGIVMGPLLLYVPRVFGLPPLDMKAVAGLTMVQALGVSMAGGITHRRGGRVDGRLARAMGGVAFAAALAGSLASRAVSGDAMQALFAVLALAAAVLMVRKPPLPADENGAGGERHSRSRPSMAFAGFPPSGGSSLAGGMGIAAGVGFLGGIVGQTGAFLYIPLLSRFLKIPLKTCVGTTLVVVACASVSGVAGKAAAGQISWPAAAPLAGGAVLGALLGARGTGKLPEVLLRRILAVLIAASAVKMTWDVVERLAR